MKLFTYLSLIFFTISLEAQCDSELLNRAKYGITGYQDRGGYWEGFYEGQIRRKVKVQLVRFTKGKLTYSPSKANTLALSVPIKNHPKIHVQAIGIQRDLFYQMDAYIDSNKIFRWETDKVLLKESETESAKNIGLYGFLPESDRDTIYPIQIRALVSNEAYYLQFIANKMVRKLSWRIQNQTEFSILNDSLPYYAEEPIDIKLPSSLPPGIHTMELKGKAKNGITPVTKIVKIRL